MYPLKSILFSKKVREKWIISGSSDCTKYNNVHRSNYKNNLLQKLLNLLSIFYNIKVVFYNGNVFNTTSKSHLVHEEMNLYERTVEEMQKKTVKIKPSSTASCTEKSK